MDNKKVFCFIPQHEGFRLIQAGRKFGWKKCEEKIGHPAQAVEFVPTILRRVVSTEMERRQN